MNIVPNTDTFSNLLAVLPEILLTILAVVVILLDAFSPESRRRQVGYVAAFGMFAIAAVTVLIAPPSAATQFMWGGMIRHDTLSQLFRTMVIVAGGLASLISMGRLRPAITSALA